MSGAAGANETPAGAATETVSATRAAADAGDLSTFLEADRQSKAGKPPAPVTRPKTDPAKEPKRGEPGRPNAPAPVAGKDGTPAAGPSAADAAADERLRTRIQDAVTTATAESTRRIAELEARLAENTRQPAPAKAEVPAGEPAKNTPEYKRYLAMPDAPKAEDFESVLEHSAAVALFINRKVGEENAEATRNGANAYEKTKQAVERVKSFHGRINTFKEANAALLVDNGQGVKVLPLSPEVKALHGYARLQEMNAERQKAGQPPLPATVDHAIAEEVYDSDIPGEVGMYLSQHPEELGALRQCKTPAALIKAFGRVEDKARAQFTATAGSAEATTEKPPTAAELKERAAAAVDRSVSAAKPPAPSVGKAGAAVDPLKKAVDTGDVGMFLELDRQAMAERRGIRR